MEVMSTATANAAYAELVAKYPPRIIRTEAENEYFIDFLEGLDARGSRLTKAERELADLVTLLVEDFEEQHYSLPRSSPLDALKFLMEQHGLRQKDMVDAFGTPSIVSEVMNGKREMTKGQIVQLSKRFHVSPEIFF
jgi:HTH-type transcriptional regulator/antitoxin HigA